MAESNNTNIGIPNTQVKLVSMDENGNSIKQFFPVSRSKDVYIDATKRLSDIDFSKFEKDSVPVFKTLQQYMDAYNAGALNNIPCIVEEAVTSDDDVDSTTVENIVSYLRTTHYFNISSHVNDNYNEIFTFPPTKDIVNFKANGTKSGLMCFNGYLSFLLEEVSGANRIFYNINYYVNDTLKLSETVRIDVGDSGTINIPLRITIPIEINDIFKITITDNCHATIPNVILKYNTDFAFGGE